MQDQPKRAAVSLDEVGDRRLSEISAADFLQLLEQSQLGEEARPEDVTVRDAVIGARAVSSLLPAHVPKKKKAELEKPPRLEGGEKKKLELEKPPGLEGGEKKKLELEKPPGLEGGEKKKLELEKPPGLEGGEKKKVELEKQPWSEGPIVKIKADNEQPIEPPEELARSLEAFNDRLTAIEQKLEQRSS